MKTKKLIGLYLRVSTSGQVTEGFGLDVQRNDLCKLADFENKKYKIYEDGGVSGTSTEDRKGLEKLLQDVRGGLLSEVWVHNLSRLARNNRDMANIAYELEEYNISIRSHKEKIDTSSKMGKVMMQFFSIMAEFERDNIVERTRAGSEMRSMYGKIYGCPPVLGYNRIGSGHNAMIEINVEEELIIKKIYELYKNGFGYKAIANKLNRMGYKTKKGNLFAIATIKGILSNPLYAGKIRYNYYKYWSKNKRKGKQKNDEYIFVDGLHKQIISYGEWEIIQKKMLENKNKRKAVTGKFLLNGLLKCPMCGNSMVGVNHKRKTSKGVRELRYYTCGAYHNKGSKACLSNLLKADVVEDIIIRRLSEFLNDHKVAKELHKHINFVALNENIVNNNKSQIEKQLAEIETKKNELLEYYVNNQINKEMFDEAIKKLSNKHKQLSEVTKYIEDCKSNKNNINVTIEYIKQFLKELYNILLSKTDRLKTKVLIRSIIKNIKVIDRSTANIIVDIELNEEVLDLIEKEIPEVSRISFSFRKTV